LLNQMQRKFPWLKPVWKKLELFDTVVGLYRELPGLVKVCISGAWWFFVYWVFPRLAVMVGLIGQNPIPSLLLTLLLALITLLFLELMAVRRLKYALGLDVTESSPAIEVAPHAETLLRLEPRTGKNRHGVGPNHLMWAELEVENLVERTLQDVEVRIETIDQRIDMVTNGEERNDWIHEDEWSPASLIWSIRNAAANTFRMTLPAKSKRTLSVAYSDDSDGPPASFDTVNRTTIMHGFPQRITLSFSSPDFTTFREDFYIECRGNEVGSVADALRHWYSASHFEFKTWDDYDGP
jgi:hypothetical protein